MFSGAQESSGGSLAKAVETTTVATVLLSEEEREKHWFHIWFGVCGGLLRFVSCRLNQFWMDVADD